MTWGIRTKTTVVLLAAMSCLSTPSVTNATLFGWLCHRRTAYRVPNPCSACAVAPTTAYSVPNAVYPVTSYSLPVTVNYPQASHRCGCHSAQQTAITGVARPVWGNWAAPTTTYRTVWAQVPTTYYRPNAVVPSVNCAATTTLQPCSGYSWQARRVPYYVQRNTMPVAQVSAYLPVARGTSQSVAALPSAAPIASEWTAAPNSVVHAYPNTTQTTPLADTRVGYANSQAFSPSCPATVSGNNSSHGSSNRPGNPVGQATYPSPVTTRPTAPSTFDPGSSGTGFYSDGSQLQPVPAEQKPNFAPTIDSTIHGVGQDNENPTSLRHEPALPSDGVNQLDIDENLNSVSPPSRFEGPSYQRREIRQNYVPPNTTLRSTQSPRDPRNSSPSVQPIPDPNRQLDPWSEDQPPSLLDAGERTARRATAKWDAVPISWQEEVPRQQPPTVVPALEVRRENGADTGGWTPSKR